MNIKIFGRPNCQWCDAAKNLLSIRKIPYTYVDLIDMPDENRRKVFEESGMQSVPIIKIDDVYIGGFKQLKERMNGEEAE